MRVRELIRRLNQEEMRLFKKTIPNSKVPIVETENYPSAIMKCLDGDYAKLGLVTEAFLQEDDITIENLVKIIRRYTHNTDLILNKKSTTHYINIIKETREILNSLVKGKLVGETAISCDTITGHPDCRTETQIFEIKTTGHLKEMWTEFLLQVFAYGAIDKHVYKIYLILPLQKYIWEYDLKNWKNRDMYLDLLLNYSKKQQPIDLSRLICEYRIGHHIRKDKTLYDSIVKHSNLLPYQIFLGNSRGSAVKLTDSDIAKSLDFIDNTNFNLYIHAPYVINLCNKEGDMWHIKLLNNNLKYGNLTHCKGVVVHVGKSTKRDMKECLQIMKDNIEECLEFATLQCPLLIETPAGQGTEVLQDMNEFIDFVSQFDDRVGICLDTCHVFACGHDPVIFMEKCGDKLKLIHFNDSSCPAKSKKDRHALPGNGYIGKEMISIANMAITRRIHMVIE